ncbi:MAG TPA: glycoside hydrolase family 5 protein [Spirochaetes bacterium]|nr:glycoside hydrolase family 5 protein [Spirochaetota bacterium]
MKSFILTLFTVLFWAVSVTSFHGQGRRTTPTSRYGQIQVIDRQLCSSEGIPVQLRGMSTHGLQWYGWGGSLTGRSLDVLSRNWKADILRLSMYPDEGGYKTDPEHFRDMIDTLVDETLKRGMYCIIDWHILDPGDPMENLDEAEKFFAYMSNKHGQKKYILYEICNEPNGPGATWPRIKSYAEKIIPIIRMNDRDGIIIVGTPEWSSLGMSGSASGKEILKDPLTGNFARNVMYSFHFYASSHGDSYREQFPAFAQEIPIFVSEWGSQNHKGEGRNDVAGSQKWLDLLDRYSISWVNWNYSDDWRSGAVWKKGTLPDGPFTQYNLKKSGRLVRKWLREGRAQR